MSSPAGRSDDADDMSGAEGAHGDQAADEHAEVERLRAEVVELRAEAAETAEAEGDGRNPPPRRRRLAGAGRWTGVIVVAVVIGLLTPVTLLARYARSELLDTDRYVSTVAPLAQDPAIQDQVADAVTTEIFQRLDIENVTRETLQSLVDAGAPDAAVDLATPIANQVENFARDEVRTLVSSEQFATLWAEANRVAHVELDALLTGDDEGAVQVEDGKVTLELGPVIAAVRERLVDQGFGLASNIPEVSRSFTLVESDNLSKAQTATRFLNVAATALPFVIVLLVIAAVLLAPNRRRGLVAASLAVVLGALVLALVLAIARSWLPDNLTSDDLSTAAASSIVEILMRPLRTMLRAVLVLALVVTVAGYLAGPSAPAVAIRRGVTRTVHAIRSRAEGDRRPSAVESWVGAHKPLLRMAVVLVAVLALALWSYPTGGVVLLLLGLVLVAMAAVEVLGASTKSTSPPPTDHAAPA